MYHKKCTRNSSREKKKKKTMLISLLAQPKWCTDQMPTKLNDIQRNAFKIVNTRGLKGSEEMN